jgi:cytochrome oxidase Cu insertion factor (SCO1/SenC/PrrC family)
MSNRVTLLLIAACFITPMIAAYVVFHFWQPQSHMNYGELIAPQPMPDIALKLTNGENFHLKQLRGKWIMLQVDSGECQQSCAQKLYNMRQVRLAQGKDMSRVERVWLITGEMAPNSAITGDYLGTWFVKANQAVFLQGLPKQDVVSKHIYIIDPLGNLMLRYPENADPRGMNKDLQRLLKVSSVG